MITYTVGTTGRDYATITLAWAAIPGTLADSYTLLVYDDTGGVGYTETWNLTDRNTSSGTYTITIKAAPGHSFYDNASKASNALRFNPANGVAFTGSPFNAPAFIVSAPDVTIDGIQFDGGGQTNYGMFVTGHRRGTIKNCILKMTGSTGGGFNHSLVETTHATTFDNCLIYGQGNAENAMLLNGSYNDGVNDEVHNCTVYVGGTLNAGNYLLVTYGAGFVLKNTAAFGPTSGASTLSNGSVGSNNCTDMGTAGGVASLVSKVAVNQFVSVTGGVEDFRVQAGSDLANAGVRDATFTGDVDILKAARSLTTPTIGAHEVVTSVQGNYYVGADISAGAWTPSTGATLFGTIDETARDDSDYDQSGLNPVADTMEVKFVSVTTPGSTSNHVVTYVIWASGTLTMQVSLVCGTTVIKTWTHAGVSSSPTQYAQTLLTSEAATITNYSDLRLRVRAG